MQCRGGAISPEWITSNAELADAASTWGDVLGLDTEFQRTNTFYPIPGLYQLVSEGRIYLIDPLLIDEWTPFKDALEDEDRSLVMHAPGEDLELMLHHLNARPTRLFDTQLAHAFVSTDFSLSYTNLVRTQLGAELGKPQTRSDWLKRPLTDAQVHYACEDVEHLPGLHARLEEQLRDLGRFEWFGETMEKQGRYEQTDPDRYYLNMKTAWRLKGSDLAVLKWLAGWRERVAMAENVPRKRVVWDEHLVTFAECRQLTEQQVWDLLPKPIAGRYADELVAEHRAGREAEPVKKIEPPLSQHQGEILKQLREVARAQAESLGMSQELLARKRDVESCIRYYSETGELSQTYSSWREPLLGDSFRDILGRL